MKQWHFFFISFMFHYHFAPLISSIHAVLTVISAFLLKNVCIVYKRLPSASFQTQCQEMYVTMCIFHLLFKVHFSLCNFCLHFCNKENWLKAFLSVFSLLLINAVFLVIYIMYFVTEEVFKHCINIFVPTVNLRFLSSNEYLTPHPTPPHTQ